MKGVEMAATFRAMKTESKKIKIKNIQGLCFWLCFFGVLEG
jgi:hypothetical protein